MTTLAFATPRSSRTGHRVRRALQMFFGFLAALGLLGWLGLQIPPAPFPPVSPPTTAPTLIPLPAGLPAPVARFYRYFYGDQVPVIESAVITGRGSMRILPLFNLTFPARFRWTHDAGQSYRHYIELTFFGYPILTANEYFVDGKETMALPWGVQTGPQLDQAGNLGMWGEAIEWLPALLLTDPRVRWEPVDEATALLVVPFDDAEERFVVRFDPATGDIQYWEAMRYREATGPKSLWISGTWMEDGQPWLWMTEENTVLNVPVDTSLTAKGP